MGSIIQLTAQGIDFNEKVICKAKSEGITYMEAIIDCCDQYGLEPESVAKLLSKPIKEKVESEAIEFNFRKSKSALKFE